MGRKTKTMSWNMLKCLVEQNELQSWVTILPKSNNRVTFDFTQSFDPLLIEKCWLVQLNIFYLYHLFSDLDQTITLKKSYLLLNTVINFCLLEQRVVLENRRRHISDVMQLSCFKHGVIANYILFSWTSGVLTSMVNSRTHLCSVHYNL